MEDTGSNRTDPTRVVAFANNRVGYEVVELLSERTSSRLVGLVLHPEGRRKLADRIREAAGLPPEAVFTADELARQEGRKRLSNLEPEVGVSAYFGYLLDADLLALFPRVCVNVHPSYLPYNRGKYPNVWSIVEGTPAGASLHVMEEKVDAGPIIARREVPISPTDTGKSLYRKLEDACIALFRDVWPDIEAGTYDVLEQPDGVGSHHLEKDVEEIDPIDLDQEYTARDLINRLRARTFPPYEGCYFKVDGRRVFMRLDLWWEEEYPPEDRGDCP